MSERWSADVPFISHIFVRSGQVVGEVNTCQRLLEMEEAVCVFPEGVLGISKLYKDRYKLQKFGHGFMRIALKTKSPILPVALIGAEEQAPSIANFKAAGKLLGMPALPLIFPQLVPLPLPVKYRIYIGKPIHFEGDEREDEKLIEDKVGLVKSSISSMLRKGLRARKNIFY